MSTAFDTPWGPFEGTLPGSDMADRILDAAFEQFVRNGVAATTMSSIAQAVGISRVWLYRHYPNRDAVMQALLARETHRFLEGFVDRDDPSLSATDSVINAFVYVVRFLRGNEFLHRVLASETEAAPFLIQGTGPVLRSAIEFSTTALRKRTGMREADARAVVETLVRLIITIVLNNDTTIDFDNPRQVRAFASRVIPRLLAASPSA